MRKKRINVYIVYLLGLIIGITGIYQMKISGSFIEDMSISASFFKDNLFFDVNINGIVPLEV